MDLSMQSENLKDDHGVIYNNVVAAVILVVQLYARVGTDSGIERIKPLITRAPFSMVFLCCML